MVGFSPDTGSTWVRLCMNKEGDGGYTARRSRRFPSLCALYRGEGPSVRRSCWKWHIRWPASSYQSYLFLCNQNNGYIHQPRINTIHLDRSPLWLETRGINSFSIETTMNTNVVLFPKCTSRVFVCGQVSQSICMYQFHSQMRINTKPSLNTRMVFSVALYSMLFFFEMQLIWLCVKWFSESKSFIFR